MGQSLVSGQVFAGYRIERLLGVGGMGEVFLAHDPELPRYVALKLLSRAQTGDLGIVERFRREADTAARLAHPNIVAVHARGELDGQLWIAMEYVNGTDVDELLRSSPLDPRRAVRIVEETAAALDHAHRAGVLHRDVKPANILLASGHRDRVLLADFGIAKILDESVGLTRTGEVFASLRYAAPEQFTGTAIDHRADIYALGGTLHHMLTGSHPYPGTNSAQLIHSHLNQPAPAPSASNPALPGAFDSVIARAMAKDPADRFDSCGELAAAAADALTGTAAPAATTRLAAPDPPPRRSRRRRGTLIVAAVLAGVFALCGTGVVATESIRTPVAERLHKTRELAGGFVHRMRGAVHDLIFMSADTTAPTFGAGPLTEPAG
ncbi:serine/threonine-protein kinase [Nocardia sp. NPDC051750]|uniref:serine/threonine-protein kinase n=1 Tax=Nocardia sp. NPDC051750 TaxID=3364325 RepID=UPI0037AB7874